MALCAAVPLMPRQLARFVVVGVVNTAFSYAIYAGLVALGMSFVLANLLSLVVGVLFSFKTQGTFVFANDDNRRLVRFAALWACLYGVNVLLIAGFMRTGASPYAAGALAIVPITALSFLGQKFVVFRAASRA